MIKTVTVGYCKQEFQVELRGGYIPRGGHVYVVTTIDGVTVISLAEHEK